jgi:hypothetical protein
MVPNVVKSKEGWELYIVADDVIVGILISRPLRRLYSYMFRHLKCHHQGIQYERAEMVPNVVKSREGWELYVVTDGVMVGILISRTEHRR